MTMRNVLAALILGAATVATCGAEPAAADHWQRRPVLGIPLMSQPPVIDGAIDGQEWGAAAVVHYSLDAPSGQAEHQRTSTYVAHSATHLFVAFQCHRPEANRTPTTEDLFELQLDPLRQGKAFLVAAANLEQLRWSRQNGEQSQPLASLVAQYKARTTEWGWEGEIAVALADLEAAAGGASNQPRLWNANFGRVETTPRVQSTHWSFVGRLGSAAADFGQWIFLDRPLAVSIEAGWLSRYREVGLIVRVANFSDQPLSLSPALELRRAAGDVSSSFLRVVEEAVTDDLGQPRGDLSQEITKALDAYPLLKQSGEALTVAPRRTSLLVLSAPDDPGFYLASLRLADSAGNAPLAAMAVPVRVPEHLGLTLNAYLLTGALTFEADLRRLKDQLTPQTTLAVEVLDAGKKTLAHEQYANLAKSPTLERAFHLPLEPGMSYTLRAKVMDGQKVLAQREAHAATPAKDKLPDWWLMKEGYQPLVPPPFTPVAASARKLDVVGRTYRFDRQPLPAQITTQGQDLLAAPCELRTTGPWTTQKLTLVESKPDFALYHSTLQSGTFKVQASTRVEFDGFMLIDLDITGSGSADALELVIPFKKQHAVLMQNYRIVPGPWKARSRFHGQIPAGGYKSPPFITTWIGTDHYGLEWCTESFRGWSIADPEQAVEIRPESDRTLFIARLISKPIPLSDQPRRIRFSLVATPTKPLMPYIQKGRMFDDINLALLPGDWSEFYVWHPPMKNAEKIAKTKAWVQEVQAKGQQLLVNGGWNISVQDPANELWVSEMFTHPLENVSFDQARQYAGCWNSPYGQFMANSFAYNARLLNFDGIRFDTVTPGYPCESLAHDCGWFDDQGNRWASYPIYSQREVWKRLYRTFHGDVIEKGWIYTPNASGPIMAVHSFSDHHEIGEGFYQQAPDLKTGYPPGMVRAVMTGEAYGFRVFSNIKDGPLYYNERYAGLLPHNAEPQVRYLYKAGYEAHAVPGIPLWEAWEWVDRFVARFLGWWENEQYLAIPKDGKELYGSFWWNKDQKKVLLVVSNYEKQPLDDLPVTLALDKLGLSQPLYAEDVVTGEPVALSPQGQMKLDILGQRYRLLRISSEPPHYRDQVLGPNLVTDAPPLITKTWRSAPIALEPDQEYLITAWVKIDQFIGAQTPTANFMGKFSPSIRHYATAVLEGAGVTSARANRLRTRPDLGEDRNFKHYYAPQWWEPTPGWTLMFIPYRTGPQTKTAQVVIGSTDPDSAQFKDVMLRKVSGN